MPRLLVVWALALGAVAAQMPSQMPSAAPAPIDAFRFPITTLGAVSESPESPLTTTPTTTTPTTRADDANDDDANFPRSAFQPTTTTPTATAESVASTLSPVATPSTAAALSEADVAALRAQLAQLADEHAQLTTRLRASVAELELLELEISNEQRFYAEAHAATVVRSALPSPRGAAPRALECQGWKKTARCSARGARRPAQDRSCLAELRGGAAGYCEVRDAASGEHFKVMRADCTTVRTSATFWCELAPQFANFPAEIERAVVAAQRAKPDHTPTTRTTAPTRGIVVVVLASQLPQLARLVRALRASGCALPIEVWYFAGNMAAHAHAAWPPAEDPAMTLRPLTTLPFMTSSIKYAKIHAVANSAFTSVLSLDVGAVPLRDPTYLFSLPQFQATGTLFWPDVLHPSSPESRVVASSLLWELLDMPFARMFETDDRQWLVNRDAPNVRTALRVLELFTEQRPNLFLKLELVERTKDFARLAWLKTRTPFHMVAAPPVLGGSLLAHGRFCGTHVVQHDPNGELLFIHPQVRNTRENDESLLRDVADNTPEASTFTHVQVYHGKQPQGDAARLGDEDTMLHYDVRSFEVLEGGRKTLCYDHHTHFRVTTTEWDAVALDAEKSISRRERN